ncbi:MAG: alpha/beta hydrolase [bacterium]
MELSLLLILLILSAGVLIFRPIRKYTPQPSGDIHTASGRTTFFHFPSQTKKSVGTIICVHGFCENHLYFQSVAELLTAAGYDCLAINLFGYAGSQPRQRTGFAVTDYARQIQEVMAELKKQAFVKEAVAVLGHSMGGTSLFCASTEILEVCPELKALIFENPGFGNALTWFSQGLLPLAYLANVAGVRRIMQFFVNLIFARRMENRLAKNYLQKMVAHFAPAKQVAVANTRSVSACRLDLSGLPEILLHRLYFVLSKKDKLMSCRKVEALLAESFHYHSHGRGENRLILNSTDHFVSLQAPDKMAAFVLQILQETGG